MISRPIDHQVSNPGTPDPQNRSSLASIQIHYVGFDRSSLRKTVARRIELARRCGFLGGSQKGLMHELGFGKDFGCHEEVSQMDGARQLPSIVPGIASQNVVLGKSQRRYYVMILASCGSPAKFSKYYPNFFCQPLQGPLAGGEGGLEL